MIHHVEPDRLTAFLLTLECLDPAGRTDAFMNEVMECGGTYVAPQPDDRTSHLFEIALHGISGWGASEEEAIRRWTKAARAGAGDIPITIDPPFPRPRNHGEEIANARFRAGMAR